MREENEEELAGQAELEQEYNGTKEAFDVRILSLHARDSEEEFC